MNRFLCALAAFSLLALAFAAPALGREGDQSGDYVAAGGSVEPPADVDGDLYAAGGNILVRQRVEGDTVVAGGNVTLQGKVRDDVYAAGGSVLLNGEIGGDVRAAGGHVTLSPDAEIQGRAQFYGANIDVRGRVGKDLKAVGEVVRLGGEVQGDADLTAREVEILPTAKISGKLTYRSPHQAKIDPAAQILGGVAYSAMEMERGAAVAGRVAGAIGAFLLLAGLMALGGILLVAFPDFTRAAAGTIGSDPGKSLALGFALLVAVPVAGVLLMVTIVGIPLGLTIFLLYPLALLLGYLTAAFYIGDKGLSAARRGKETTLGWRFVSFALALIAFAALGAIPFVGSLIVFFLLLLGLGAWVLNLYYRLHGDAKPKTA